MGREEKGRATSCALPLSRWADPPGARPCLADCRVTAGTLHAAAQLETQLCGVLGTNAASFLPLDAWGCRPTLKQRTNWGRGCVASMLTVLPGYEEEAKKPTMKRTRDAFPSCPSSWGSNATPAPSQKPGPLWGVNQDHRKAAAGLLVPGQSY